MSIKGTWILEKYTITSEDNEIDYPLGQDPVGHLIYTNNGYMTLHLAKSNRPHLQHNDPTSGEISLASYFSYVGKFKLTKGKIIHKIQSCSFPNWNGIEQERFYEIKNDKLLLKTAPMLIDGKQNIAELVWNKI